MTVLCAGLSTPHAGWVAIDELAHLLAHYFQAELLSAPALPDPWLRRLSGRLRPRFAPIAAAGGDVLMVVARNASDLAMVAAIPQVRQKYQRLYAFVTDSYFEPGFVPETALFDAITVTAHEDAAYPARQFGIPVHPLYQGADCLQWAPRTEQARSIDLIGFGRTPPSFHHCFTQRFHSPASPYLYLHSPLGQVAGPDVHRERGMLFKLLQRTQLSLAFHLFVEPQGNRPRSMMVTSRWLESLLAGCVVVGRRPQSRMADDMLNWPGATQELPEQPEAAADAIEALLAAPDALAPQRHTNIERMLSQHDWRHRLRDLCALWAWEVPALLREDLEHLAQRAQQWRAAGT